MTECVWKKISRYEWKTNCGAKKLLLCGFWNGLKCTCGKYAKEEKNT